MNKTRVSFTVCLKINGDDRCYPDPQASVCIYEFNPPPPAFEQVARHPSGWEAVRYRRKTSCFGSAREGRRSGKRHGSCWWKPGKLKIAIPMNADIRELLQYFARHEVRYLVVGGYAAMHYSQPRFTKDLDLWLEASSDNAGAGSWHPFHCRACHHSM